MRCARVCLLIVLLAATACGSSGSTNEGAVGPSSSNIRQPVNASDVAGTTTPPKVVGFRGSVNGCPARYPAVISNTGGTGLGSELIPIDATKVRICRYRATDGTPTAATVRLDGTAVQTGSAAEQLRAAFNRLPPIAGEGNGAQLPSCVPPAPVWYLLTFAADSQVVVVAQKGCPYVTNNGRTSGFTEAVASILAASVVGTR
jgi:hypothetical protein